MRVDGIDKVLIEAVTERFCFDGPFDEILNFDMEEAVDEKVRAGYGYIFPPYIVFEPTAKEVNINEGLQQFAKAIGQSDDLSMNSYMYLGRDLDGRLHLGHVIHTYVEDDAYAMAVAVGSGFYIKFDGEDRYIKEI